LILAGRHHKQLPALALGAHANLGRLPLGVSVLRLPRVVLERRSLVPDVARHQKDGLFCL
jgi:hypothetical protein